MPGRPCCGQGGRWRTAWPQAWTLCSTSDDAPRLAGIVQYAPKAGSRARRCFAGPRGRARRSGWRPEIDAPSELAAARRYDAVRPRLMQMDMQTQWPEMRRRGASPDYAVGSVHAVSEQGEVFVASASGSQLAAYVSGAGSVIWVVGSQKIVPDRAAAFKRIYEYSFPREDERAREAYGIGSGVNKVVIVNREFMPDRITVILVKQELGF